MDHLDIALEEDRARLYNAFDPLAPADMGQYVDMDAVRGTEGALIKDVLRHIHLARDHYVRFLFSGHIGCGKSSELKQLNHILLTSKGERCFFPVFLDTHEYLSDYDTDPIDLLLAVVAELATQLRDNLKIELKDNYFKDRLLELKSFLFSEVEVEEAEVELWKVKAKLKLLKANDVARTEVRQALRPRVATMLGEINSLLTTVRGLLREKKTGYTDLVLIVDNLEKIRKVTNAPEGFASHRELFLEQHAKLTGFDAHVIYTVSLRLVRSTDAPQLLQRYDRVFVVPSVKVMQRDRTRYDPGDAALRSLIERRITPTPLPNVFTEEALAFLLRYCGGHVRHLMIFIRTSIAYVDKLPIDLPAARKALRQMINIFSSSIPEAHWDKLAALDQSEDQKIINGDSDYLALLENQAVLEYVDGIEENDAFASAEPWYAVHPVVRELQKFRERTKTNGHENGSGGPT